MNNYGWLSPEGEFIKVNPSEDSHLTSAQDICADEYNKHFMDGDQAMNYLYDKAWTRVTRSDGEIYMSVYLYDKAKSSIIEFVSKNFKNKIVNVYDNNNGRMRFTGKGFMYLDTGLNEYNSPQTNKGLYGWLSPDGEFYEAEFQHHDTTAYNIVKKQYKDDYKKIENLLGRKQDTFTFLFLKGWTRIAYDTFEYCNKKAIDSIIEIVSKHYKNIDIDIWKCEINPGGEYKDNGVKCMFRGRGYEFLEKGINENKLSLKRICEEMQLHGLAQKQNKNEDDFDPEELQKGIGIEMEHTDDEETAKQIALDHLTENPKYYTDLENAGID